MQHEDNKSVTNDVLLPVHRFNKGVIIDAEHHPQV